MATRIGAAVAAIGKVGSRARAGGLVLAILVLPAASAKDWSEWDARLRAAHEQHLRGDYAGAAAALKPLVAEAECGGAESRLGVALHNLGVALFELGSYRDAERELTRSLKALSDKDGLRAAGVLTHLATIYAALDQFARAQQSANRALETLRAQPDPPEREVQSVTTILASIYTAQGQVSEAEQLLREAILRLDARGAGETIEMAEALNVLGNLEAGRNRWLQAREAYARAVEVNADIMGRDHPSTAKGMVRLAAACRHSGQGGNSEELARTAVSILEARLGRDHPDVAAGLLEWAASLRRLKRRGEANSLERRAKVILAADARENLRGATVDRQVLLVLGKK